MNVAAIHVTLEGTEHSWKLEPVHDEKYKGGVRWAPGWGQSTVWLTKAEMRALSGVKIRAHFEGDPDSLEHGAMKHVRTRPRGTVGSKQVGTDGKRKPWRERTQGAAVLKFDSGVVQVKVRAIVTDSKSGERGEVRMTCAAAVEWPRVVLTPAQRKKQYYEGLRLTEQQKLENLAKKRVLSLAQTAFYIGRTYAQTKQLVKAGAFLGAQKDWDRYVTGRPIPPAKAEKFGPVWHIPRASVDAWLAENGGRGTEHGQRPRKRTKIESDAVDRKGMRWEYCEVCGHEWKARVKPGPRPSKCDHCRFNRLA